MSPPANLIVAGHSRFGRGLPQDLTAASQLHVLAAESGDAVALGNLNDYRHDLEQLALGGNATASLSLATMYERGLAVEQDQPTALAWLAWGKARRSDGDEATRTELLAMYKALATTAENSVRRRAARLLQNMRSAASLNENTMSKRKVSTGWDGKPLIDKNGNPLYDYDDFGHNPEYSKKLLERLAERRKAKAKTDDD